MLHDNLNQGSLTALSLIKSKARSKKQRTGFSSVYTVWPKKAFASLGVMHFEKHFPVLWNIIAKYQTVQSYSL